MKSAHPLPHLGATALVAAAVLSAPASFAQGQPMGQSGEFSVQRFEPVAGPRNYMSVAGGRTDGEWTWSAGMLFDYQREPFVVISCATGDNCDQPGTANPERVAVVRDMLTWNVLASLTPHPIVQVGLRVPVMYSSGDGIDFTTGSNTVEGVSGAGVGDINLEGKVRILGEPDDMVVLAGAVDLAAPVGHASADGSYIGNDSPIAVGGRAIVDFQIEDFSAAANLRGIWRKEAQFGDTMVGPEFRWGVGAGYQVHELFKVIAEGYGATRFSSKNGTNSIEIDGGVQAMLLDERLVVTVAGGAGVLKGIGVPMARAIAGLSFNYEAGTDDDGDGVANDADQCPTKAEDRDGIADDDGCPEDDFDHDNIPDDVDNCPEKPETENQFKDDDGCPDVAEDADGDGVMDGKDKCPNEAGNMTRPEHFGCPDTDKDGVPDKSDNCKTEMEDTDGFEDTDGCPDPDNDGDGVPDIADECGDEAEIMNGVDDGDGCPDWGPDADGDGIEDDKDQCAQLPENYNGVSDDDGCTDAGVALIRASRTSIETVVPIRFNGTTITDPVSDRTLTAVASALKNFSLIELMEVKVTTPAAEAAQGVARAKAIIAKLVAAGVDPKRLTPKAATGTGSEVTFTTLKAPQR